MIIKIQHTLQYYYLCSLFKKQKNPLHLLINY